jgi:folate-binding protein YgfZ
MTQTDLSETLQTTPLSALLAPRIALTLANYRGVQTPCNLDTPQNEMEALLHGAALHDLGWKRRVAVRGEDRFRWLSGMVTNTVNDLFPNSGAWNLVLNAQGHIQGDLTVWRGVEELSPQRRKPGGDGKIAPHPANPQGGTPFAGEGSIELEMEICQYEKLIVHLERFIIMDDVELVTLGAEPPGQAGSETCIGLTGPLADQVLNRVGLPQLSLAMQSAHVEWNGIDLLIQRYWGTVVPHYQFWLPVANLQKLWSCLRTGGAMPTGFESFDRLRIAEGVPLYGVDMAERDLPQETAQNRALHFNKGCYQGQEIVERIHSRGHVNRHLRSLELTGPAPAAGTVLQQASGEETGVLTSAAQLPLASGARTFGLAMIRSQVETGEPTFTYSVQEGKGTARILALPPAF